MAPRITDLPDHGEYWVDEKHFDPSFMQRVQYHRGLAEPLPSLGMVLVRKKREPKPNGGGSDE